MAIRDLLVTAVIFGSLPVCFVHPWVGVLMWSWIGYMSPHRLTWGFAYDAPFAEVVAIVTLAGFIVSRERYPLPRTAGTYILAALWIIFAASTLFSAIHPKVAWGQFEKVSKILLMTFVTLFLFQDVRKLRTLLWVIVLSLGFYGLKGGVWALLTGAQNRVYGPEGSFIGSNNECALALNMILPLILFLRRQETRPWVRNGLTAMFGFTVLAILSSYSRAGFLGLAVVLTLLLMRSRMKVIGILVLALSIPVSLALLPEKWMDRMQSIQHYQQDASAMSRIHSWYVSYRLALDHPGLGAGFRPFSPDVYEHYIPGYSDYHDAHSIFFQVMAEHGFTGFVLYVSLIISVMLTLRSLIRTCRGSPKHIWIRDCADAIFISIAGYMVSGLFASMSYFDLFYHLVAVTLILRVLARDAYEVPKSIESRTAPARSFAYQLAIDSDRVTADAPKVVPASSRGVMQHR